MARVTCWRLVLVAAATSLFFPAATCGAPPSFEEWCLEYGKSYPSDEERSERERIFSENADLVEGLNAQYKDHEVTFQLNQFADMTATEFKTNVLMPAKPAPAIPDERLTPPPASLQNLPDTFDWRDHGVVTSVKNQGSAGSCWAFSTVENVEGQWALGGNSLTSLSAEQLVDCDATYDPNNLHQDCGVFGGWPYLAYQYIERVGGIESEANYPYCCGGSGDCFPCVPAGYNKTRCGPPPSYCNQSQSCGAKMDTAKFVPGLKVTSWVAIAKNETVMQAELVSRGPLSVLINAATLQFYHSGVWDPIFGCDPKELDHAVLLVGYGTYKGLFEKKPYWLIKNSWGKKWGKDGYFMMIRGKGECGVDQAVTSAVLA